LKRTNASVASLAALVGLALRAIRADKHVLLEEEGALDKRLAVSALEAGRVEGLTVSTSGVITCGSTTVSICPVETEQKHEKERSVPGRMGLWQATQDIVCGLIGQGKRREGNGSGAKKPHEKCFIATRCKAVKPSAPVDRKCDSFLWRICWGFRWARKVRQAGK
jgi:hypothetical protein